MQAAFLNFLIFFNKWFFYNKQGAWGRMDLHTTLAEQVPHRPGHFSDFYLEILPREIY